MCGVYSQVLEMVATTAPEVFTDWKRQSAELHIARLFQVNMQKLCHQFYQPRMFSIMCANSEKSHKIAVEGDYRKFSKLHRSVKKQLHGMYSC